MAQSNDVRRCFQVCIGLRRITVKREGGSGREDVVVGDVVTWEAADGSGARLLLALSPLLTK